ncbi:TRAP transporter large permease subunit [uncultured Tateyamaria sp.]|uniref:TRAP transporter large permease subunit n=1 Tax=uncultured Tateyamaria sp. TaxID=455651 RepID=UPI002603328F|nr:TRAP transporter large permease subunit [uncultured Tateyamaria sp.]
MIVLIVVFAFALLLLGFEIFLVLGIPALAIKEAYFGTLPDAVVVQKIFAGIDHTTLLAIPFFIFAAHLMGSGQIARHLTDLVRSLLGHTRGGIGHTMIGGSMAFGSAAKGRSSTFRRRSDGRPVHQIRIADAQEPDYARLGHILRGPRGRD